MRRTESVPSTRSAAPGWLVRVWLLVLPVTAVLVVPGVQGTTAANVLALALAIPAVQAAALGDRWLQFARVFWPFAFAVVFWLLASQLALLLSTLTWWDVRVVPLASELPGFHFRLSLFTQSAYVSVGLMTLCLFRVYYHAGWDRWLMAGALVLAMLGYLECGWHLATGTVPPLSNRSFGAGGLMSGSLEQVHRVFGPPMLRIKSLTGEPSMYALSMLPYVALALQRRWWCCAATLVGSLVLTVSTTAYLGLAVIGVLGAAAATRTARGAIARPLALVLALALPLALVVGEPLADFFSRTVLDKLGARELSGASRLGAAASALNLWWSGSVGTRLVGIGFGFVRSTDLLSTLLVNIGAIGLLGWCALFVTPAVRGLARGVLALPMLVPGLLLGLMLLAVPEYAYLPPWAFLGIAYAHVDALAVRPAPARSMPSVTRPLSA